MAKVKYYYDTETCRYQPIIISRKNFLFNIMGFLGASMVIALALIYVYHTNFTPYKEIKLREENSNLKLEWDLLQTEMKAIKSDIDFLQYRDDYIYRTILDLEPIPSTVRKAGAGGHNKYQDLSDKDLEQQALIIGAYSEIDNMKRGLYIQTKSYDEITKLVEEKEKMWAARPAIQPINNKELIRIASGYNPKRWHPILNVWRPHMGLDFTAPKGTPVYATGDGVVKTRVYSTSFGNVIFIDHGYGYETRYAHLSGFNVKRGQKVKRGDCIGYVGNTGLSEASHLHYEIVYNNAQIDPINFFQKGLSNSEYERLIEISASSDVILD